MQPRTKKREKGQLLWFRIALFVLPWVTRIYFKLVSLTSRTIVLNREYEEEVAKNGGFAVAGFHGTALLPAYYFRRYGGVIMVSRSWDGDLINRCVRGWGYDTARGSSSRDGKEALAEMVEMVKLNNSCAGLAVDAPRGPARKVKMGVVILARETGQPILPVVSWTSRHVQFRSWDSMILPLPFSTIVISLGKPTMVPKGLYRDAYEALREEIENNLMVALAQAQNKIRDLKHLEPDISVKPIPSQTSPF
ncbi:MAG: lysophospholipid acyltransferase family protein [Desulfomonile sp.]